MGRKKIEMEMVQDANTRQVTFSKRRTGLFKKASELATLCNAELGIVVFSPGGKPFSYGKPSVEAVAERFTTECEESDIGDDSTGKRKNKLEKMSEHLNWITKKLEAEKSRGEELEKTLESVGDKRFMKPIEELSLDELKEYKAELEKKHDKIQSQATQMHASSCLMLMSKDKDSCKRKRSW